MDAITVLCEGTIKAAGIILQQQGVAQPSKMATAELEKLTAAIRETLKAELPRIMDEWKTVLESHTGSAWLQEVVKAQCVELATMALAACGLPEKSERQLRYEKYELSGQDAAYRRKVTGGAQIR